MEIVYVLVGIVALVAVYFLFLRKQEPEKLEAPPGRELPEKREETPKKREEPKPKAPVEKKTEAKPASAAPAPAAPAERRAVEEAEVPIETEAPAEPSRPSLTRARDVVGLRKGLAKSRSDEGFFGKLKALISGKKEISPAIAEDIEEILLASDVGVATTQAMLARIKETLSKSDLLDSSRVWDAVRDEAKRILEVDGKAGAFALRGSPTVVLMVGVNGAGKTTTIGKLATKLQADGKKVVLAAGDTFRAAAVQQLVVWGDRVGCEVVRGKDGADPGSVVFDAIKKAQETGAEVVLADTAGRLHTKTNLMAEMKKIAKTADKALAGAPHEVLLVVDATNGQNALAQAKEFKEQLELTGIVLTKLDGTAKGGVILGICDTFGVPVRFVGLGERPDDLRDFSPDEFVEALLGPDSESSAA
ncbi:MAG: signal recognition particle-docking protein FtsY [Polyangiaceae bacterium]|nr:signal recognition particle-docking protein FtsY [Polyangiaceae bacterium]